jgi:hypothetical protein
MTLFKTGPFGAKNVDVCPDQDIESQKYTFEIIKTLIVFQIIKTHWQKLVNFQNWPLSNDPYVQMF